MLAPKLRESIANGRSARIATAIDEKKCSAHLYEQLLKQ